MAASTTSLPETPGGERNWDYRYTWIRDTAFMLRALHGLGFDWEAFEYFAFILDALGARLPPAPTPPTGSTSRSCTGSAARPTSPSTRSTISPDTTTPVPCASATVRTTSVSTTCGGCSSTSVGSHIRNGGQMAPQIWDGIAALVDTAIASEPRTRPGHLGDAGQAAALRGVEGDVLGRRRAGHPPRRIAWRHRARRAMAEGRRPDARRDLQEGGRRPGRSSPSTTAPTRSTRRCC